MKTLSIGLLLSLGAISAYGQLGGRLKKNSSAKGGDVTAVMTQGQDLLTYVTIATDSGVKAVEAIVSVFPPAKVEKLKVLAAKYNELKGKRTDQNIDSESY